MNKTILTGRFTKEPELKQTKTGKSVISFTLAVDRAFKKEGEKTADFINLVAWEKTAEFISRYFRKGSPILVIGRIETRDFTDSKNNKRTATEVIVEQAEFFSGKADEPKEPNEEKKDEGFEEVSAGDDLPF